jgi:hypothetical protein
MQRKITRRLIMQEPNKRYRIVAVDFMPEDQEPDVVAILISGFMGPIGAGYQAEIIPPTSEKLAMLAARKENLGHA